MSGIHLDIWYGDEQFFARHQLSQQWVNILGRVSPVDQIQELQYILNDGPLRSLSVGPDYRRLTGHGDFNIEIDSDQLVADENRIMIVVTGKDHTQLVKDIRLLNVDKQPASLPQLIEWRSTTHFQEQMQIVDGLWRISNSHIWTVETGYDRCFAVGSRDLKSYEMRVPVTIYGFSSGGSAPMSGGYGIGIGLHWRGHVDWGADAYASGQPRHGYEPLGAMAWYGWDRRYGFRLRLEGHDASTPLGLDESGFQLPFGHDAMFCFRVQNRPGQQCLYALKAWLMSQPEPEGWLIEAEGSGGELTSGSALIIAHHTVCRFGSIRIDPIQKNAS